MKEVYEILRKHLRPEVYNQVADQIDLELNNAYQVNEVLSRELDKLTQSIILLEQKIDALVGEDSDGR